MLSLLNKIEYLKICFKHALQFPFVEVVEDGVKGREVPREHTPLAPRFDYVHDSIHNVPIWLTCKVPCLSYPKIL